MWSLWGLVEKEVGSRWGIHVNPWLIHVNVWQNPLQYCKVISLQLIKINGKKKNRKEKKHLHECNPILKKGNPKECSNYCTIALISHTSKVMLKILQARLQQYVNWELLDFQTGFRKGRGTRDQIANIRWIIERARVPEKHLFLLYWLCQSLWLCGSQ